MRATTVAMMAIHRVQDLGGLEVAIFCTFGIVHDNDKAGNLACQNQTSTLENEAP